MTIRTFDPSTVHHPAHVRLYENWSSKITTAALPGRQNIEPLEIPDLLSAIALIDVVREDGACRFRYRLAGTEIGIRAERDPTGKFFEDLYEGEYLKKANSTYRGIVDTGAPFASSRKFPLEEGYLSYDRLILPLASDGKQVDMLIFLPVFLD